MCLSQRFSCVRSQVASQAFILCNCLCCWPVIPKDLVPDDINEIDEWSPEGLLVCMHDHACKHQVMQVCLLVCQSSHKHGSIAQVMQVSVYICMPTLCYKYSISYSKLVVYVSACSLAALLANYKSLAKKYKTVRSKLVPPPAWCASWWHLVHHVEPVVQHADKSFISHISGVSFRLMISQGCRAVLFREQCVFLLTCLLACLPGPSKNGHARCEEKPVYCRGQHQEVEPQCGQS